MNANAAAVIGQSMIAAKDERVALGQMLMLATQPDVHECAIVALGSPVPSRPGCRVIFVCDEGMVRRSVALANEPTVQISSGCIIVQLQKKQSSNRGAVDVLAPGANDELRSLDGQLGQLYQERRVSGGSDLDLEIERLERKAAALISARNEARMAPLRTQFEEAVRVAKDLLGKK